MKKFAVFGNPIAQSLSPTIHHMFADQVGEKISYEKILAPVDGFADVALAFLSQDDVVGCNVTMPFKLDAFKLADVDDQAAKDASAVNTLMKSGTGTIKGFNTDGIGLVNDLLNNEVMLNGKRILLLGAGGAARGVIAPLFEAGICQLTIANRTISRAQSVAEKSVFNNIDVIGLDNVTTISPDIIINSTASSLSREMPCEVSAELFKRCDAVYDMVYKNSPTPFMNEATRFGVNKSIDGLGMLVEQAAAAFTIWTGKTPDTSDVLKKLRLIIAEQ